MHQEGSDKESPYIESIISEGFYEKCVVIGFPYDFGAREFGRKTGSYLGPDSFRRFYGKSGVRKNVEW